MHSIVFYEVFAEEEVQLRKFLPKQCRAIFREETIQASEDLTSPAPIISIRTQSQLPRLWLQNIKAVFTRSSGFDHLTPLLPLRKQGLSFGYLPSYCARSVAEHALLATMALMRKLKKQIHHFNAFDRNHITGRTSQDKTLLIVGVGKIGSEIAHLGKAIGMQLLGVDLVERLPWLKYVSLEEGIAAADAIVCALPLTAKTQGLLDYEKLRGAKKEAVFVNISRGEISPICDLQRLLDENFLAGISLDVYEGEAGLAAFLQGKKNSDEKIFQAVLALKDRDNVIFTPHNAFNSDEDLEKKASQTWEALSLFLSKGVFPNEVPEEP